MDNPAVARHMRRFARVLACAMFALSQLVGPFTALADELIALEERGGQSGSVPLRTQAAFAASGQLGDDCSWSLDNGVLAISGGSFDMPNGFSSGTWQDCRDEIVAVEFTGPLVARGSLHRMFSECANLVSVSGLSNLDTSSVTDMNSMFRGCSSLAFLDVSGLDTSRVVDMGSMFEDCSSLMTLDVSRWDTGSVTFMHSMFAGCSALGFLDLARWDTARVTNMHSMFHGCTMLVSPGVAGWKTSVVRSMSYMFSGCASITSLDLSAWDISYVIDMLYMFNGCTSLATLDVSGWDNSYALSMENMFENCPSLWKFTVGSSFSFKGKESYVQAVLPEGDWLSARTNQVYKPSYIAENRNDVPGGDTYIKVHFLTDVEVKDIDIPTAGTIAGLVKGRLVAQEGSLASTSFSSRWKGKFSSNGAFLAGNTYTLQVPITLDSQWIPGTGFEVRAAGGFRISADPALPKTPAGPAGATYTYVISYTVPGASGDFPAPPVVDESGMTGNQLDDRRDLPILLAKGMPKSKTSVKLTWSKCAKASGYEVYWSYCDGKRKYKKKAAVSSKKARTYTVKKLKKNRSYKFFVTAYKKVDGKKVYISKSPDIHVAMGSGKYTNAKSISVAKPSVTLKRKGTCKIVAKVKRQDPKKKLLAHVAKLRYYTSDKKVATVSAKGKISAKGKGKCNVYVVANNGVYKKIKVTVK